MAWVENCMTPLKNDLAWMAVIDVFVFFHPFCTVELLIIFHILVKKWIYFLRHMLSELLLVVLTIEDSSVE